MNKYADAKKKAKKGKLINQPQLQRMEVLDAMNWTRWPVMVICTATPNEKTKTGVITKPSSNFNV